MLKSPYEKAWKVIFFIRWEKDLVNNIGTENTLLKNFVITKDI